MFNLFVEGGVLQMAILTLIFIALFLAAWKAPAWVKEIGIIGLVVGIIGSFISFMIAAADITETGRIPSQVFIWNGLRLAMITTVYGLIIFMASLIIRVIQKPRI
jgi:hypothetical protein